MQPIVPVIAGPYAAYSASDCGALQWLCGVGTGTDIIQINIGSEFKLIFLRVLRNIGSEFNASPPKIKPNQHPPVPVPTDLEESPLRDTLHSSQSSLGVSMNRSTVYSDINF